MKKLFLLGIIYGAILLVLGASILAFSLFTAQPLHILIGGIGEVIAGVVVILGSIRLEKPFEQQ